MHFSMQTKNNCTFDFKHHLLIKNTNKYAPSLFTPNSATAPSRCVSNLLPFQAWKIATNLNM